MFPGVVAFIVLGFEGCELVSSLPVYLNLVLTPKH